MELQTAYLEERYGYGLMVVKISSMTLNSTLSLLRDGSDIFVCS
jgi:hypothetical protein